MSISINVSTGTGVQSVDMPTATPGVSLQVGASAGTNDHRNLTHRDAAGQHPISAITGLPDSLPASLTNMDILAILNS